MAKGTEDALLRIRAKNLASQPLREVREELDKLTEKQKQNAEAALLAKRKINDLRTEYENLRTIEKELARRNEFLKKLQADKAAIGDTQKKLRGLTAELNRLQELKASNVPVKGLNAEIKRTENAIKATNTRLSEQTKRFAESSERAQALGINAKRTAQAITQINEEAARTAQLVRNAETALHGYSDAVRQSREAIRQEQEAQRAITEEAQRRADLERRASEARIMRAREELATEERIAKKRADSIAAFSRERGATASVTPFSPGNDAGEKQARAAQLAGVAAQRENDIRERLIRTLAKQKDGGERLLSLDGKLAKATREVSAALDKQAGSSDRVHKLGGLLSDTGRKSLSIYQRLRGQILATAAAYVGLYQAVNLVASAVSVEQQRRRIDIQLRIANKGDVEASKRDVTFLRAQADRLGLVYEDLAKNYANYKIAGAAVGLTNRAIKSSFVDATEIVTGLGLSAEDADGVFRAFVQILGKARVQAEELRGQLGDRLPGAVAKFAEANNIALSQLDAYLKKGKGNVQNFLNFLRDYAATTKSGVEENSKTLFAQFNRLKNAYRDFLVQFAQAGVSSGLLDVVNQLIAKLKGQEGKKLATDLAKAFEFVAKMLLVVIENFDTFVAAVKFYLGLQAAKAVSSLFVEFAIGANKVYGAIKRVVEWTAALNAARIAGTGLTVGMRGLMFLLGPVGIAILGAAGALTVLANNIRKADAEMDNLLGTMERIQKLHGPELAEGVKEQVQQLRDLEKQEQQLLAKRREHAQMGDTGAATNPLGTLADMALGTRLSIHGIEEEITLVHSKMNALTKSIGANLKRLNNETRNTINQNIAEALEAPKKVDAAVAEEDKKSNDATIARAEALKERKHDIAARSAQELLDIQKSLSEARLEAEITSQTQIDANLKETLAIIGTEIEKRRQQLLELQHDAERIKSPEAVATAQTAINMLPQLQAEQEAKAKIKATTEGIQLAEQKINDLIAERDAGIEAINARVEAGLLTEVEGRQQAIDKQLEYKDAIISGADALLERLAAIKASEPPNLVAMLHVDELIAKMDVVKTKAAEVHSTFQLIGKNLGGQLSQGVATFFSTMVKGAAGGIEGVNGIGDAFKNALNGFREFLANFLVGIGEAILQAILLQAIMNAINGTSGGFAKAALGAVSGAQGHTGGVVGSAAIGSGNSIRQVSAAVFAAADRYHEGGLPGLKPNEVPAILKKREEVLTEDDPRNVLNGGGNSAMPGAPQDVTIINQLDSGDIVETGLGKARGKKAIFNAIAGDVPAYRKILGIGG
jgi:tape measure domain-containing protein